MNKYSVLIVSALLVSACTWVKPIDGAQSIKLASADYAANCQSLGRTTSKVKSNLVGSIPRSADKVQIELITLAKNAAIEMGGDTIVKTIPMNEGSQTFAVYKCQ